MTFFDRDKVVLQKVQEAYQKGFEDGRGNHVPASPVPFYGTPAYNEGWSRGYDEGHADAQKGANKKGGAFEGGYKLGHRKGVQEGYRKGYDAGKQKGLSDEYVEAWQGIAPEFVARIIREWREYQERLQELGEIEVTVVIGDPASRPEDDPDWPRYVTWLKKGGRTGASEMNQEETKRQIRDDFVEQLQDLARADPDIQAWFDQWGQSLADAAVYGSGSGSRYPKWSMATRLAKTDKRVRQVYLDMMQEYVSRLGEYPNNYIGGRGIR